MKKNVIIICSIVGVIVILLAIYLLAPYKINLNGEETVKINYKEEYVDEGAYLTKLGIKNKSEIKIDNNVDTSVLGEYTVIYKFKDVEKTRKVIVADLEKPSLEITKGDITIFVNEDYIEYGAISKDNYDGDITKKIEIDSSELDVSKIGEYNIKYSICDEAKNCNQGTRKVSVVKGDIFYGTFKQKTDVQSSIIKLRGSDKTFTMDVNLCEGFATINGTYSVSNKRITLKFKAKQYKGFSTQSDTKYVLDIQNNDNIKFQSHDVLCGPYNADIYERTK